MSERYNPDKAKWFNDLPAEEQIAIEKREENIREQLLAKFKAAGDQKSEGSNGSIKKIEEPFNPDEAFNRLFELYNEVRNLDYSNKIEAGKQSKEINDEVKRLVKLREDYYEEKIEEFKKKHKDSK